jgi:hypothetical protein
LEERETEERGRQTAERGNCKKKVTAQVVRFTVHGSAVGRA